MSIGDYHRTARVLRGLKCVRDEKIETVANRVGFKSKKNFYRACHRMIDLKPAEFRRLPDDVAGGCRFAATVAERPTEHRGHQDNASGCQPRIRGFRNACV